MITRRAACQPEQIGRFLGGGLSEVEERLLQDHLDVCEACQSRFDEAIASLPAVEDLSELKRGASSTAESLVSLARRLFPVGDGDLAKRYIGRVDHFGLVQPLGSGGMGLVYQAEDTRLHRTVALKILSPTLAVCGTAKQRFAREAVAAAAIQSPHVVPIHAVSECEGLPYLVMSYVEGVDLQAHLSAAGPLAVVDALKIASQVAAALAAAHRHGVIHRDVKPANILLQPSVMRAWLTDFGLARVADDASLTLSGMAAGTPHYMSPEQIRGEPATSASDWYGLGGSFYAMLTGRPPFSGSHAFEVLDRMLRLPIDPPSRHREDLPPWVDRFSMRLLAKDPAERLIDAEQIVALFDGCVAHLQRPTERPLPQELTADHARTPSKRFIAAVSGCLVAVVCLASIPLWYLASSHPLTTRELIPTSEESHDTATADSTKSVEGPLQTAASTPPAPWVDEQQTWQQIEAIDTALLRLETSLHGTDL